jgi:O-antigen ligase
MGRNRIVKISDKIIESGIIFLIIFTPLAFGTVHVWAYTLMELTVIILLLVWLFKMAISYRLQVTNENPEKSSNFQPSAFSPQPIRTPLTLPLLLFLCLILFQMLPLPPSVIKHLSPNTYNLYKQTLPGYDVNRKSLTVNRDNRITNNKSTNNDRNWRPISICRHATKTEFFKILAYIGVFFLITNNLMTGNQVRRLVLTIIIMGAIVAFVGLLQMLSGTDKIYWFWESKYRISSCYFGPYVSHNHFAGYMEMVIPLSLGLLIAQLLNYSITHGGSWRYRLSTLDSWLSTRVLLIFAIIIMIASLFFSLSRGGIISFLLSMVLFVNFLLFSRKKRRKTSILLISIFSISLIFLIWLGVSPIIERLSTLSDLESQSSYTYRKVVAKDTLSLIKDFPTFGCGLGNFQHLYPKYQSEEVKQFFWDHTHNDYLEYLSEVGVIGSIIVLIGIGLFLIKVIKRWREREDPYVKGITLGVLTALIAIMCHSISDFNLHIPANAMLLAIILGLAVNVVNLRRTEGRSNLLNSSITYSLKTLCINT